MTIDQNYPETDWRIISLLPILVGATAACAATSGLFGTIKESMASVQTQMAGERTFPSNDLIAAVAPNPEDMSAAKALASAQREAFKARIKTHEVTRREELLVLALDDARRAAQALPCDGVSFEAINGYKEWIISIAENVSKAAKEGGFLGIGGTHISVGEQQFVDDLRKALGMA